MVLFYTLTINLLLSLISGYLTFRLVPSVKGLFVQSVINRRCNTTGLPSKSVGSFGVIAGTLYLISMFLFIPVPYVTKWMRVGGERLGEPSSIVGNENSSPHELVEFIVALLSICCMLLLSFADDVLHLRLSHKLLLPSIGSSPLLMVYYVNGGPTVVTLPNCLKPITGISDLDLGFIYYIFICIIAVFTTNSLTLRSGINGIETGQSIAISLTMLLYSTIELNTLHQRNQAFPIYFLLPFIATSLALHYHGIRSVDIGSGKVFSYYSGMIFSVISILRHFNKTMLLFFIPQMFDMILRSIPQCIKAMPQTNNGLPTYDQKNDQYVASMVRFRKSAIGIWGSLLIQILSLLNLTNITEVVVDDEVYVEMYQLSLVNVVMTSQKGHVMQRKDLINYMMFIQIVMCCFGLCIRYGGELLYQ